MGFYRKKPIVIEARQLSGKAGDIYDNVISWIVANDNPWLIGNALESSSLRYENDADTVPDRGIWIDPADGALMIRTLEGDMRVSYGDWIIKGVSGELYPCKPDIFEMTYEEAVDA